MDPRLMTQLPQQDIPTFPQDMIPGPPGQPMLEFRQPAGYSAMAAYRMNGLLNGFPALRNNLLSPTSMQTMQQMPLSFLKTNPIQQNSPFVPWTGNSQASPSDRQAGNSFHSPGTSESSTVQSPGDIQFIPQVDTYGIPHRIISRYGYAPPAETNPPPPQGVTMPEAKYCERKVLLHPHFNPTRYIVKRNNSASHPQLSNGGILDRPCRPPDYEQQMNEEPMASSQESQPRNEDPAGSRNASAQPEIVYEGRGSAEANFDEDDEEVRSMRESNRRLREQEQMRDIIAQRIEKMQKAFTSAPKSASELPRPRRQRQEQPSPRKPRAEKPPPIRKIQNMPLPPFRLFLEAGYRKSLALQESRNREASNEAAVENNPSPLQEQPEQPLDQPQQEKSCVVHLEDVREESGDQECASDIQQTSTTTIPTENQEPAGPPTQSFTSETQRMNKYFHPKLTLREIVSHKQSLHKSSRISQVLDRSKESQIGSTHLNVSSSSNKESRKRVYSPDGTGQNTLNPVAPRKMTSIEEREKQAAKETLMGSLMVVPESTMLELEALPIRRIDTSNQGPHDFENEEAVQEEVCPVESDGQQQANGILDAPASTFDVESQENMYEDAASGDLLQGANHSAQETWTETPDDITSLLEQVRQKIQEKQKSLETYQIKQLIEELEEQLGSLKQALQESEIVQKEQREYDDDGMIYHAQDEPGPSIQAAEEAGSVEEVGENQEESAPIAYIPLKKFKIVYTKVHFPDMPALEPVDCLKKVKRSRRRALPPQLTDQNGDVIAPIQESTQKVRPISRFTGFDPEKGRRGRKRKFYKGSGQMLKNCIRRYYFQRLDEWVAIQKEYLPNLQCEYEKLYSAQDSKEEFETIFSTAKALQSMVLETAQTVDFPEGCPAKQYEYDPSKKKERSKNDVNLRTSGRLAGTPKVDYREK